MKRKYFPAKFTKCTKRERNRILNSEIRMMNFKNYRKENFRVRDEIRAIQNAEFIRPTKRRTHRTRNENE